MSEDAARAELDRRLAEVAERAASKYGVAGTLPGGHPEYDIIDYAINEIVGLIRYLDMIEHRAVGEYLQEGRDDDEHDAITLAYQAMTPSPDGVRAMAMSMIRFRQALQAAGVDLGAAESEREPPPDMVEDVADFRRKFAQRFPPLPTDDVSVREHALAQRLVWEEYAELSRAMLDRDLEGVADGGADLVYVVIWALLSFGVDLRPVWRAVQRANMAKVGGGKDAGGKITKPDGWTPPDILRVLAEQSALETEAWDESTDDQTGGPPEA